MWHNILAIGQRIDLIFGFGDAAKVAPGTSLDGAWGASRQLVAETCPFVLAAGSRYYLGTVSEGTARLTVRAQGGDYEVVRDAVEIGDSDAVPPVLAMHPTLKRIFAAVQNAGNTVLHVSDDQGATWTEGRTVTGLKYPNLHVDGDRVWTVGYVSGAYQGARGQLKAMAFAADKVLTPLVAAHTVGPSDEGRPALIIRPGTRELIAVAVKVGAFWTDLPGNTNKGIAEYRSVDSGGSWVMKAIHGVT